MTALEPGASEVFTWPGVVRPRAAAFRARRPAASITPGFEVFVQEVIAAITTDPWARLAPPFPARAVRANWTGSSPNPRSATGAVSERRNDDFIPESATRSCGRFGPARLGSTAARSSSSDSLYSGSGVSSVRKSPCRLVYASTRATVSGSRPVRRR